MIITRNKTICKIETNSLSIQGSENKSHYHTSNVYHRHYVNVSGGNHSHSMTSIEELHDGNSYIYGSGYGSKNATLYTSESGNLSMSGWDNANIYNYNGGAIGSPSTWNVNTNSKGTDESRPNNYTILIWKRIS